MSQSSEGTRASDRLRDKPRKSYSDSGAATESKAHKAQISQSVQKSSNPTDPKTDEMDGLIDCPVVSDELKPLVKYMEFLQKRSQNTVVESVESCKLEIRSNMNEMIDSIKLSVEDMKNNFRQLENSMEKKIGEVQLNVSRVESKADEVALEVKEIKRLELSRDDEREQLREKVKAMEHEICSLKGFKEKVEAQLVGLRGDVDRRMDEQESSIKFHHEKFDKIATSMENDMDAVKIRSYGNLNQIRHLCDQVEELDNRQRSNNLIIEGLPEKPDDESKTDLVSIINGEIRDFQTTMIKAFFRLGKRNEKKKKPRLLLVTLHNPAHRDLILARASEIRKKTDNKFFWINKDQNDISKRKHALVKSCYKLLLENKYACSLKGSTITYNGRTFGYESLNLLPQTCTPFHVKSRETSDGKGLCFYSEHTYCSNFHPAKIRYRGSLFTSVEHAYQTLKVKDAGYEELAAEMQGILNPYSLKKIGGDIKPTDEWKQNSEELMEELIRAKFNQNPKLRYLLECDNHSEFYEMTADKRWATGVRIKAGVKTYEQKEFKGLNLVGLILTKIKKEFSPPSVTGATSQSTLQAGHP